MLVGKAEDEAVQGREEESQAHGDDRGGLRRDACARLPADVLASTGEDGPAGPVAKNKWLVASVIEDAAAVVGDGLRGGRAA